MKRLYLLSLLTLSAMLFAGCAAYVATPVTGMLFSDVKVPVQYDSGENADGYELLGMAEGTSEMTSILGLIATGDASIATAHKAALDQFPNADALVDVTVDYQGKSVLGIYASFTTIVRGKAVKFNED